MVTNALEKMDLLCTVDTLDQTADNKPLVPWTWNQKPPSQWTSEEVQDWMKNAQGGLMPICLDFFSGADLADDSFTLESSIKIVQPFCGEEAGARRVCL